MDGNSRKEFLKQLYMKQSKGMFRYANSIMRDNYLAEDAVQETFAVAWEKIESLVGMDSPVGWLFGTLKNIMKKNTTEMHKFQKQLVSLDGYNDIDQAVNNDLDIAVLYEGIISSEEFSILEKLYIHGYTYKELASEMKVPLSTVGMKAKRAREKFRKKHGK